MSTEHLDRQQQAGNFHTPNSDEEQGHQSSVQSSRSASVQASGDNQSIRLAEVLGQLVRFLEQQETTRAFTHSAASDVGFGDLDFEEVNKDLAMRPPSLVSPEPDSDSDGPHECSLLTNLRAVHYCYWSEWKSLLEAAGLWNPRITKDSELDPGTWNEGKIEDGVMCWPLRSSHETIAYNAMDFYLWNATYSKDGAAKWVAKLPYMHQVVYGPYEVINIECPAFLSGVNSTTGLQSLMS